MYECLPIVFCKPPTRPEILADCPTGRMLAVLVGGRKRFGSFGRIGAASVMRCERARLWGG